MRKRKKHSKYGKYAPLIPLLALILVGIQVAYMSNSTLNFHEANKHNKTICLQQLSISYSGIIDTIRTINGSKQKMIILKDSSIRYPMGLYHQLHLLSQGDSIIKKAGSFAYIVFPSAKRIDSFIIDKHEKFSCDFKQETPF